MERTDEVELAIMDVSSSIKYALEYNFNKWKIQGVYTPNALVIAGTWEKEIEYCASYFKQRVEWLNHFIDNKY